MGFRISNQLWAAAGALAFTAISCSLPFLGRNVASTGTEKTFQPRPAKLSGVLTLKDDCTPGYYQVKLQGLFDSAQIQVDSQTDQSGHFSLIAPPGQYLMIVNKEECGSRERIVLEENTEHMLEVPVQETKAIERTGKIKGRLPASVLVEPKR
jgi:hypothetical protein